MTTSAAIGSVALWTRAVGQIGTAMPPDPTDRSRGVPQLMVRFRRAIERHLRQHIGVGGEMAPAIAVGLVTAEGDLAFGLGTRELGERLAVDGGTLFAIGSISKVFTGLALARAVAAGELTLDTRANDWLDETLRVDERITLGDLVSHRSGLPDLPENMNSRQIGGADSAERQFMPAKDYSTGDLANCLSQGGCRPKTTPGSYYEYSSVGIGLLNIVLQDRFGYADAAELNRGLVTQGLGMDHTGMNKPEFLDRYRGLLAQGYGVDPQSRGIVPVPPPDMGILAGAGEVISNVNDMNLLLKCLTGLTTGELGPGAREMNRELSGSRSAQFGIGYAHRIVYGADGAELHFQSGFTAGYTATILWRERPEVGLVLLSNRGKIESLPSIGRQLLGVIAEQLEHPGMRRNDPR